jgi:hypothetical protein
MEGSRRKAGRGVVEVTMAAARRKDVGPDENTLSRPLNLSCKGNHPMRYVQPRGKRNQNIPSGFIEETIRKGSVIED